MSDLALSKVSGKTALLLPCIECGDGLELPADCTGLRVDPKELDQHGWILSSLSPLDSPLMKLAPLCGGCAEHVYGAAELHKMRELMRAKWSTVS